MTDMTRMLDALEFAHSFFEARAQMATPGSEGAGKLHECAKGCADAMEMLKAQEPRTCSECRHYDTNAFTDMGGECGNSWSCHYCYGCDKTFGCNAWEGR